MDSEEKTKRLEAAEKSIDEVVELLYNHYSNDDTDLSMEAMEISNRWEAIRDDLATLKEYARNEKSS